MASNFSFGGGSSAAGSGGGSSAASAGGGFQFGAGQSSSGGGFSFGAASGSGASNASFSFGGQASGGQAAGGSGQASASSASFLFSGSGASQAFGAVSQSAPAFGASSGAAPSGGFSFGDKTNNQPNAPASVNFSFGGGTSSAAPTTGLFGAGGAPAPVPAAGDNSAASASQAGTQLGGFSTTVGSSAAANPSAGGAFSFGGTGAASTSKAAAAGATPGATFNFGGAGAASASTGNAGAPANLFSTPQAASAASGASMPSSSSAPSSGFSFGVAAQSVPPKTGTEPVSNTAAGATQGGFSFGAAPAFPAASSAATTASSAPSAAGSAFTTTASASAGGAASGATPSAGSTTAPSFSLGPAPAQGNAASSSSAASTSSSGANAQFNFGGASTATAQTAPGAPTGAPAASKPPEIPSEIKELKVDEIVNKWSEQVEELVEQFRKQAVQVGRWDRQIVTNEDRILFLNQDLQTLQSSHKELEMNLDTVLAQQTELHNLLDGLEKEVDIAFGEDGSQNIVPRTSADQERAQTHELGLGIMRELDTMAISLKDVVQEINQSQAPASWDIIGQIVSVLNAHMNALQYLDESTGTVQKQLQQVATLAESTQRDAERLHSRRFRHG